MSSTNTFLRGMLGKLISGVLDGVKYFLCGMKEPDYIMKMMATGGSLFTGGCREVVWNLDSPRECDEEGVHLHQTLPPSLQVQACGR